MTARSDYPTQDPELIAHEQTYHVFNLLLRWCMVLLGAVIAGLTVSFATPAGVLGGLVVGLLVFIAGYMGLVRREEHQPLDPWVEGR